MSLRQVMEHLAALVEGSFAGATYPIPSGHFVPTDQRTAPDEYPAGGATRRYELLWTEVLDGEPGGKTNVSGNIVDATASVSLVVIYHAGGGRGVADRVEVNRMAADDWHRIRRCLSHGANYDEPNTGIENVELGTARVGPGGQPEIVLMTVLMTVQYREDWTLDIA